MTHVTKTNEQIVAIEKQKETWFVDSLNLASI